MLRVARSTIPTVSMPSLASPFLVRQSLSVALAAPGSLSVGKGLRVVFRPSPAFQLQSALLCLIATISGVFLLLHPSAFGNVPIANRSQRHGIAPTQTSTALPVAGLTTSNQSAAYGAVLGHILIGRLHINALVREGADKNILQGAVGHVPSTEIANQSGNFALAGHRETFFSSLRAIRPGDTITFQGEERETYVYRVFSTRIVKESDVSVLKADGGFASAKASTASREQKPRLLTLITCYPFARSEKATERFIVQADLQSVDRSLSTAKPLLAPESSKSGQQLIALSTRTGKGSRLVPVSHN
jgi:LPXTG-site transpeptidase (sortase) family protein